MCSWPLRTARMRFHMLAARARQGSVPLAYASVAEGSLLDCLGMTLLHDSITKFPSDKYKKTASACRSSGACCRSCRRGASW